MLPFRPDGTPVITDTSTSPVNSTMRSTRLRLPGWKGLASLASGGATRHTADVTAAAREALVDGCAVGDDVVLRRVVLKGLQAHVSGEREYRGDEHNGKGS